MGVVSKVPAIEVNYAWVGAAFVDFTAHTIERDDRAIRLTPKAAAVLRELVRREQLVVRRDDLLGIVWHDGFPTDDVLTRAIKELRRALDDDTRAPVLIETIPRVGYRLRAPVRISATPRAVAPAAPLPADDAANDAASTPVAEVPEAAVARVMPVAVATPAVPSTDETSPRRAGVVNVAIGALAIVAFVIVVAWSRGDTGTRTTATIAAPMQLTAEPGTEYFPTISPDGNLVAYVGTAPASSDSALMLTARDPAAKRIVLLPAAPDRLIAHPVFSPDGARLAFADLSPAGCQLRVMPVSGGTPRDIAPCDPRAMDGFDWTPEGDALLLSLPRVGEGEGSGARGLARIALADGARQPLDYGPRQAGDVDVYPRASPDGRWIAFRRGARPYSDVWLIERATGEARLLAALGSRQRGFAWTPDSASLVISSDHGGKQALHRIEIADGQVTALGTGHAEFPSIARRAGLLVYDGVDELAQMVAFDLADDGTASAGRVVAPASRADYAMALSPSGARLAFVSERSGTPQLWLHTREGGDTVMLTDERDATLDFPQWSPDETHLLYVARGRGTSRLVEIELATHRTRVLNEGRERIRFGSYTPDGRHLLTGSDRDGTWQVWRRDRDGGGAVRIGTGGGLDPRQFAGDARIYFSKPALAGAWRMNADGSGEEHVTTLASFLSRGGYVVDRGEIWMFQRRDDQHATIVTRPVDGGIALDAQVRTRATVSYPGGSVWAQASFAGDRSSVVTNMVMRDGTDLFVMALDD